MQYLNAVVHLAPKMQELLRIIAILYIKITNKIYSQASVLAFFFLLLMMTTQNTKRTHVGRLKTHTHTLQHIALQLPFVLVHSGPPLPRAACACLGGTAVSPGEPYPPAQGSGQAVHSAAHGAPQLLTGGQTLNVAAVPQDPARQGQQHQQGSRVHQEIAKVSSADLQRRKDAQQQGRHAQQVHQHRKHQGQLAVGQAVVLGGHC